jgi:hypothetical protein
LIRAETFYSLSRLEIGWKGLRIDATLVLVRFTATALFLCLFASLAFAQVGGEAVSSRAFGVIVYADGDTVYVIRDQRLQAYDAYTGELLGLPLYAGDMIQTDPGTYVEIQLLPSQSLVKVAENTSFTIDAISDTGEGVLSLGYGRLRARVNRLSGSDPFQIRGIGAVAGVRGTDFGTDQIADVTGGGSVTRIYCFEGEVAVETVGRGLEAEPLVIGANQMVSVEVPPPGARSAAAPETEDGGAVAAKAMPVLPAPEPIPAEISGFWQREEFVAQPLFPTEVAERFPSLEESVRGLLSGDEPGTPPAEESPLHSPEAEPDAAPQAEEDSGLLEVADAVSLEEQSAIDRMSPERRIRLARGSRAVGFTMLGLGLAAEGAAAGLYFYGDQLLPDWPPASDPDTVTIIAAAGGVWVVGGILAVLFSIQISQ